MKLASILLAAGILIAFGFAYAQRFPTNDISQAQAINIASKLRVGMTHEQMAKIIERQNGLKGGMGVGSPISGWTYFYVLSNGCSLDLEFGPKGLSTNFWLTTASIRKMSGETIVTIPLTNAP
jgi:hypothetical protein